MGKTKYHTEEEKEIAYALKLERTGIGLLGDSVETLKKAIAYLESKIAKEIK
jgi:hypothetical protein